MVEIILENERATGHLPTSCASRCNLRFTSKTWLNTFAFEKTSAHSASDVRRVFPVFEVFDVCVPSFPN